MELEWSPARPDPLPRRLIAEVARRWDRACREFRRRTGQQPRNAIVYLIGNKVERVEIS